MVYTSPEVTPKAAAELLSLGDGHEPVEDVRRAFKKRALEAAEPTWDDLLGLMLLWNVCMDPLLIGMILWFNQIIFCKNHNTNVVLIGLMYVNTRFWQAHMGGSWK